MLEHDETAGQIDKEKLSNVCGNERQRLLSVRSNLEAFENESLQTDAMFSDIEKQLMELEVNGDPNRARKTLDKLEELYMSFHF